MKTRYLKLKSWLLVALGGLLGTSQVGCSKNPFSFFGEEEYGCPQSTYHVTGTVTNEKGEPVAGIGVGKISEWDSGSGTQGVVGYRDTTDAEGRYAVDYGFVFPEEPISIEFCDIDGAENGSYCDTVLAVKTEDVELTGGDGHWYEGEGTIMQDVIMKEKTNK